MYVEFSAHEPKQSQEQLHVDLGVITLLSSIWVKSSNKLRRVLTGIYGRTAGERISVAPTASSKDPDSNTWQQFLSSQYPDFVAHLSWEDGKRYTRWGRFTHRRHRYDFRNPTRFFPSPKFLSQTLVVAFFDSLETLEEMANKGEY